jgi:hypothetical protein
MIDRSGQRRIGRMGGDHLAVSCQASAPVTRAASMTSRAGPGAGADDWLKLAFFHTDTAICASAVAGSPARGAQAQGRSAEDC